ncbi:aminodeoxychorismate lyase [Vibrio sp. D404a]|uniref:aminodeoxychorismate lyase n=1 Tax=unclassified Vibrio TaxID=2614977 RepID=UPI0025541846|nr:MULTISPECIES: aminodeoxychorismate lyase [unclassified Vibrio]MDK9736635.1 aminodeoxychorismate lyase [Vibrio sp. D404a]MDK9796944.1 aminodeoxychorismate lyase [Vibrio sp. D449a]
MFWVDGESQQTIALSDRSFQYGDGCFTTMLTFDGEIKHYNDHQQRVNACLAALRIAPLDWNLVDLWLKQALSSVSQEGLGGIKLHVSRGSGGRGYSPMGATAPVVTISTFAYPEHYLEWQQSGVHLGLCQHKLGLSPMLAGHKHNNRLEQIIMKAEMDEAGYVDGIALDINDQVVETTMANLFWIKGSHVYTPKLTESGVAGVMRRQALLALQDIAEVSVGHFNLDHLLASDEVFMTNSILGIAPVTQIKETSFEIGPITRTLQGLLNS